MKDQIAVVTGGAQGIGLAVACLLAEQGARVASFPNNCELVSHAAQINRSGGIFDRMPLPRAISSQASSKNAYSSLSGFKERFLCS